MAATTQDIAVYNPETHKVARAWGITRANTAKRLAKMAGQEVANEFLAAMKKEPERQAPWISKSGFVVVYFAAAKEDSWS